MVYRLGILQHLAIHRIWLKLIKVGLGEREGGRDGGREKGRERRREGGSEGRREGGREGGREREREGEREGGREGGRERGGRGMKGVTCTRDAIKNIAIFIDTMQYNIL